MGRSTPSLYEFVPIPIAGQTDHIVSSVDKPIDESVSEHARGSSNEDSHTELYATDLEIASAGYTWGIYTSVSE